MMFAQAIPENPGRTVGQFIAIILLTVGAFKCWSISKRPTTNRKCIYALMSFLAIRIYVSVFQLLGGAFPRPTLWHSVQGLLYLILLVGPAVLATLGLVELSKNPGKFSQGRSQAIWTLALTAIAFLFGVSVYFRPGSSIYPAASQPVAGSTLKFEQQNFSIASPGLPWVKLDAAKINKDANVAFMRANPDIYFMASVSPVGSAVTTESLTDAAKSRMQSITDSARVLAERDQDSAGLHGVLVQTEATKGLQSIFYWKWCCVTNGWAFECLAWGRVQDRTAVQAEGARMMKRFRVLDYNLKAPPQGKQLDDFVSNLFRFKVRCGFSAWMPWQTLDAECQYATFGILHRDGGALAVCAADLKGLTPEPEVLYRSMLSLITKQDVLKDSHRIQERHLEGIETSFAQEGLGGKELVYKVRVLQGGGIAYLVGAWAPGTSPEKEDTLKDALSRVEFLDTAADGTAATELSAREKRVHRIVFNSIGRVYYADQRFEMSIPCFKAAVDLDGLQKNAPYLLNLADACARIGNYSEGLSALEQYPDYVNQQPALQADRAYFQGRLGFLEPALTNYRQLFASGFNSEERFQDYVELLDQAGRLDEAQTEVENFLKRQDTVGVRLTQASLLKRQKKYEEAIALLQAQRQKIPYQNGIAFSLGDALIEAGRASEALAIAQELVKQPKPGAVAWFLKGRSEFALKWYREAKASFEQAQKVAPADPTVKNYLDALSNVLGEGPNSAVSGPIAQVPVPPELIALPAAPSGQDFAKEQGAYYSRRLMAVHFENGKERRITDYWRAHIVSPSGVSLFSSFQVPFHPSSEELYVNKLEVWDSSGSLVSTGRLSDYYLLDDQTRGHASSGKILNIPVSGLHPGCDIELTLTRKDIGHAEEFAFLPFPFSKYVPVQESIVYLSGSTGAVKYASSPANEPKPLFGGLVWRFKDPPSLRWEPLLPGVDDYVPTLWISDGSSQWSLLVSNYLRSLKDRLELPEESRAMARQITAATTNEDEKIATISAYVQTNFTYKAIEFGRRAQLPQPLTETLRNKYGDCKDHASLVQQLLKAVGIQAQLALVCTGSAIRQDLPSLDQFNHMIVYLPSAGAGRFLDCTFKSGNLDVPWTFALANRDVMILDETKPRFLKIPPYPADSSTVSLTRTVLLTNNSDAVVHEEAVLKGLVAGEYRGYLNALPEAARNSQLARQFISAPDKLSTLTVSGLEDPQAPLSIVVDYLAQGHFQLVGNQIVGSLPLSFERSLLMAETVEKRTSPFEIAEPLALNAVATISLPSGFIPKASTQPEQRIGSPYLDSLTRTETSKSGWRLTLNLVEKAGRFPSQDYEHYCLSLQRTADIFKSRLIAERGEH